MVIDCGGEVPSSVAVECPVGCSRRVRRLIWRFDRWGCLKCQGCVLSSSRNRQRRDAVAKLQMAGTPLALTERELILLSGIQE